VLAVLGATVNKLPAAPLSVKETDYKFYAYVGGAILVIIFIILLIMFFSSNKESK
jgi:hypothetical protein